MDGSNIHHLTQCRLYKLGEAGGDVVSPVSSRNVDQCPKGTQPIWLERYCIVDPVSPPWQHATSSFFH